MYRIQSEKNNPFYCDNLKFAISCAYSLVHTDLNQFAIVYDTITGQKIKSFTLFSK